MLVKHTYFLRQYRGFWEAAQSRNNANCRALNYLEKGVKMARDLDDKVLILFDGDCSLCNSVVQFVIKRDRGRKRFLFAPLQSEVAGHFVDNPIQYADKEGTLVVIHGGKVYYRSSAALVIGRHLGGLWPLSGAGWILPRSIRDGMYNIVARNRKRIFGETNECMLPTKETQEMFL